ncbi:MAG: hypothetical protein H0W63_07120 [Gemmatimonadaceae bacterium]|nr:hypothetical protein [Gemmatimonadaceae bacterium]
MKQLKRIPLILAALLVVPTASLLTQSASAPKSAVADSARTLGAASDTTHQVLINREVFNYDAGGRRDPFASLMNTSELRPLLTELKLVAVAFDPLGHNSVAVLRDLTSKEQYRVRVGQTLGRMRVASIREKEVVFTIEEFGYSRQETLNMVDTTKTRPPQ